MHRETNGRSRAPVHGDRLRLHEEHGKSESLGNLVRRLGQDTSTLIQQEAALAKAEMREAGTRLARDSARIALAAGFAFVGVIALSAFLILVLGRAFGGAYWLSSLLVGGAAIMAGALMTRRAVEDMKRGFAPRVTLETLRESKDWLTREAGELKHDLTTRPATARRQE